MALRRLYVTDEELGKRDDDFRPKRQSSMSSPLNPLQWRKRRLFGILLLVIFAYFFIQNIPTDLGPADLRLKSGFRPNTRPLTKDDVKEPVENTEETTKAPSTQATATYRLPASNNEPTGAPPKTGSVETEELSRRYYDGPIRFYRLLSTLNTVPPATSSADTNHNILFATSSFKSLANLIPLACDMAKHKTNWVHVAIMGRETLSVQELKDINNVDQDDCGAVKFHDARADYSEYSTDARHEASVAGGLSHMNGVIKPYAIIIDDEDVEDASFSRAIRGRAKSLFKTLIEVPSGQYEAYKYMCRLDYKSLEHWHAPTVEILIHARKSSAGGLIKLLRTISAADYKNIRLPKLTIDLATTIPSALQTFLNNFKWPPRYEPATKDVDPVALRHHVQSQRISSEQAALRFVESFYPASFDNHVLIISPQVELSPQFFRYLHYAILEYKYAVPRHHRFGDLLGLSLDVPTSELDGQRAFVAPEIDEQAGSKEEMKTPFLYQAPSSTSLLVFGDKWVTFHDYLTHRVTASHSGYAAKTEKLVSETEPSWMEYLLELMRARGWVVLYPARTFGTVHNELVQIPEEFTKEEQGERPAIVSEELSMEEPFLLAPNDPVFRQRPEQELSNPATPLHETLPFDGRLPGFSNLPFLGHTGSLTELDDIGRLKAEYLSEFRRKIGGCEDAEARRPRVVQDGRTDDLFCLPGVDMIFDLQAEEAASSKNDADTT